MTDIYKKLCFKTTEDKESFVKFYYPMDKDSDIYVIYKGDMVDVDYINNMTFQGVITDIHVAGFILRSMTGNIIPIPYIDILNVRIINRKSKEMAYKSYNKSTEDNAKDEKRCETSSNNITQDKYKASREAMCDKSLKYKYVSYKDLSEKTSKMSPERFKSLLDELDGNSLQTLKEKNAKYAVDGDCLHNFRSGAEIMGGTPAQACWGYMTKHLTALRDKVEKNDFSDREDFLEKCQDTINYIRFLWCIGNDASNSENNNK